MTPELLATRKAGVKAMAKSMVEIANDILEDHLTHKADNAAAYTDEALGALLGLVIGATCWGGLRALVKDGKVDAGKIGPALMAALNDALNTGEKK